MIIFYEFSDKGNKWNKVELNLNGLNSIDVLLVGLNVIMC